MIVKLLTEHYLEFLDLKGGCTGSSESTLVKIPHCWKPHVTAHTSLNIFLLYVFKGSGKPSRDTQADLYLHYRYIPEGCVRQITGRIRVCCRIDKSICCCPFTFSCVCFMGPDL